ncbi:MAG: hypothetical protein ABJB66_04525 [Gemmatimonadaceae bacterium]
MPTQSIIFTALPNGVSSDGKLKLSVLVSPRLDPGSASGELRAFEDFKTWPKTISDAQITVDIGATKVRLTAANIDGTIGTPDAATWSALFPLETFVRAFEMRDRRNNAVVSYNTAAIYDAVRRVYAKLTTTANEQLPAISDLLADEQLGAIAKQVKKLDASFWNKDKNVRDIGGFFAGYADGFKSIDTGQLPLAAFQLFHTPPAKPKTRTSQQEGDNRLDAKWQSFEHAEINAAKTVASLDFHQIVSAMNQYPTLLRKLGLVLDFVIPHAGIANAVDVPISVTVDLHPAKLGTPSTPTIPGSAKPPVIGTIKAIPRHAAPVTHTRIGDQVFTPVPRPSPVDTDYQVDNGLLKITDKHFALLQADVDGAGHKLMNFARSLNAYGKKADRQVESVAKLPRRAGAPALRNAGLMLVHQNRGVTLTEAFNRNKARDDGMKAMFNLQGAPAPGLYAEDLVRGYRIDIWDQTTSKWKSLCQRTANYEIAKGVIKLNGLIEEGTVRLAATTSADSNNPDVVYLHEAVTVWNGWSLAAQQPGMAIDTDDVKLRNSPATIPEGIRLRSEFVATPGSLPKLRYGRSYGIRARVVDLAGNSLAPKTDSYVGDEKAMASAKPYMRFEPIQPPSLALVVEKKVPRLPLEGESMSRIAIRSMNEKYDDRTPTTKVAWRFGVTPRVSQREAELHGALDGAEWGTAAQHTMLGTRDKDLTSIHIDKGVVVTPKPEDKIAEYAVLDIDTKIVPYLPDPLVTHLTARLYNYPFVGMPTPIDIPIYRKDTKWPDAAPFFIRVYEAPDEQPRFDEDSRTLRIPIPKAVRATLRLSARMDEATLKLMGVWNWIPEKDRTAALERSAKSGALWPLTPWREIEIVHAVQKPLLAPDIKEMVLDRSNGVTWVRPGVEAVCHCASTEHVDLCATWHDPADKGPTPRNNPKTDVAFPIKIVDPLGYAGVPEHGFPDADNPNLIAFGPSTKLTKEQLERQISKLHDFGDTHYRRVEYNLVASTRFREYMPKPQPNSLPTDPRPTSVGLTVAGNNYHTWALSTAEPPAPEVLYVVPTFGWTRSTDASGKQTSKRGGYGLRVWLDRPWNTTGYGEMLGVILPQSGSTIDPNQAPYKNNVTQWGNDPIWKSPFVAGASPTMENFKRKRTAPDITGAWLPPNAPAKECFQPPGNFRVYSLPIPGTQSNPTPVVVNVAPHDVFWDSERRLWYCDIEFTATASYFPFVRLALARYQPSSLPGLNLSNIVLADFATLAPDRSLTVTRTSATKREVRVWGYAPEESSGHAEAELRRQIEQAQSGHPVPHVPTGIAKTTVVEVWVEELRASMGEDFGWQRVPDNSDSEWSATPSVGDVHAAATLATKPVYNVSGTKPTASTEKIPISPSVVNSTKPTAASTPTPTKSPTTTPISHRDATVTIVKRPTIGQVSTGNDGPIVQDGSNYPPLSEALTLWSGSVVLPKAPSASARLRLVVAEYEEYLADDDGPYDTTLKRKARRMVFVEHVELT